MEPSLIFKFFFKVTRFVYIVRKLTFFPLPLSIFIIDINENVRGYGNHNYALQLDVCNCNIQNCFVHPNGFTISTKIFNFFGVMIIKMKQKTEFEK